MMTSQQKSDAFARVVVILMTVFVGLTAIGLLYVTRMSTVNDVRLIFQGSDDRYTVLRNCIRTPNIEPCNKPEIARKLGEANWLAYQVVDFLVQSIQSVIGVLVGIFLATIYFMITLFRRRAE